MLLWTIAAVAGNLLAHYFSFSFLFLICLISFITCLLIYFSKYSLDFILIGMSYFLLTTFVIDFFRAHTINPLSYPHPVIVEVTFIDIPIQRYRNTQVLACLDKIAGQKLSGCHKILLNGQGRKWHAGERWQFKVRLTAGHGFANPGGFNYETWLRMQHIEALAKVMNDKQNKRLETSAFTQGFAYLREWMLEKIKAGMTGLDRIAIISGLTIGYRGDLSHSLWEYFRVTGTAHLLAISGLHIMMAAMLIYYLVLGIWRLFPRLGLWIPSQLAGKGAALFSALFYAGLAGFALPTLRSVLMLLFYFVFQLVGLNLSSFICLQLALLVILIIDPDASLSPSLWLSFFAVAALQYADWDRLSKTRTWFLRFLPQITIILFLAPFELFYFGQFAWLGIVANELAIPWLGYVIIPLSFLFILIQSIFSGITFIVAYPLKWAIDLLFLFLQFLSTWQIVFSLPHLTWVMLLLLLIASLMLVMPRGLPGRSLAVLILIAWLMGKPVLPERGEAWIDILDVGRGEAIVVETAHHHLIFGTGTQFSAKSDSATAIILPFLQRKQINSVDVLVIPDQHVIQQASLRSLQKNMKIQRIFAYDFKSIPQSLSCSDNLDLRWDGVIFDFLPNESSCILRIRTLKHVMLLSGETKHYPAIKTEVIALPYHRLLNHLSALHPSHIILSKRYYRSDEQSWPMLLEKFKKWGVNLWMTATQGCIHVVLGDQIHIMPYR